jgi:2-polyprenyl-6-hydroxyphenyl methylase/3-demethylubiquinone-9 3-methyltransferase
LDIGCAQAYVALLLAEHGLTSVGFDINYNFLTYAKIKWEKGKVFWVTGNAANLSFKRNSFDIIILGEILEHAAYPENIIMEAMNILKKGGYCIITTPNGERVGSKLPNYSRSRDFLDILVRKQYGPGGKDHLLLLLRWN